MHPSDFDTSTAAADLERLLRVHGPSGCELLVVDSVQAWQKSVGWEDPDPFRCAAAFVRKPGDIPLVVVARLLTYDMQRSVIGAMEFRGRGDEVALLDDPRLFAEHLVLHELAHLVLDTLDETACDDWAFARLSQGQASR